jgi:hypothetical protein
LRLKITEGFEEGHPGGLIQRCGETSQGCCVAGIVVVPTCLVKGEEELADTVAVGVDHGHPTLILVADDITVEFIRRRRQRHAALSIWDGR